MQGDLFITDAQQAADRGLNLRHIMEHLVETALCCARGDEQAVIDKGLFIQVEDSMGVTWTFTVMPPEKEHAFS